jgi:hypothetical protein
MTITPDQITKLAAEFPEGELSWRVGQTTDDEKYGQALPYIDNRHVLNRLDEVFGPMGWQDKFTEIFSDGRLIGVRCAISVTDGDRTVTKEDAAPYKASDIEALKGVYSDAEKRAAVHFGIGRYLYRFKAPWVELRNRKLITRPTLDMSGQVAEGLAARRAAALPAESTSEDAETEEKPQLLQSQEKAAETTSVVEVSTAATPANAPTPAPAPAPTSAPVAAPAPAAAAPAAVAAAEPTAADEEAERHGDIVDRAVAASTAGKAATSTPVPVAPTPAPAPAPAPAAEVPATVKSDAYKELMEKLSKLPPATVLGYVTGKGREKLLPNEVVDVVNQVEAMVNSGNVTEATANSCRAKIAEFRATLAASATA